MPCVLIHCCSRAHARTGAAATLLLLLPHSELEGGAQQSQQQQHQPLGADSGSYADVLQLQSHWEQLDDARKVQYAQMAVLTRCAQQQQPATAPASARLTRMRPLMPAPARRQYMLHATKQHDAADDGSSDTLAAVLQLPGVKHIAQLLARLAVNNHTICDAELRPIGVGLFPLGALLNHGCKPSCTQSFDGPAIVFRCVRASQHAHARWRLHARLLRACMHAHAFALESHGCITTGAPSAPLRPC